MSEAAEADCSSFLELLEHVRLTLLSTVGRITEEFNTDVHVTTVTNPNECRRSPAGQQSLTQGDATSWSNAQVDKMIALIRH